MTTLPPEDRDRISEVSAIPPVAEELAGMFADAHHDLYMVGGSVRGLIAGALSGDLDFATDASPTEVLALLDGWHEGLWTVGIEFGTVGAMKGGHRLEITTFRGDRYDPGSRKPDVSRVANIEQDLERRDFTINAMALKLPERTFIDPFGGLADLSARRLRTPMTPQASFSDDPLRMLRAARFVAQLGVRPVDELVAAMRAERMRLEIVSPERIHDELIKIVAAPDASTGIHLATETGLSDLFLPELPALKLEQDPVHRHKDVYRHSLAVLDNLIASEPPGLPDVDLRLAGLLHDIGKPATRRYGPDGVSFHHHEVVGARMAEERLRALHFPTDTIRDISRLIELHLRFHEYRPDWRDVVVLFLEQHDVPADAVTAIGGIVAKTELDYENASSLMEAVSSRIDAAGFADHKTVVAESMLARKRMFGVKPGWKDSAVRRYVRDAGELKDRLSRLVLADCTTRNKERAQRFELAMRMFERRIERLEAEEDLKRIRPPLDGNDVMSHLGLPPGPLIGKALAYLMELRLDRGEIPREEALQLLDEWARTNSVTAPASKDDPQEEKA